MSFQLTNLTDWSTSDLSMFCHTAMRAKGLKITHVKVSYGRGDACWGGISRSQQRIDLTLPGPAYVKYAASVKGKALNLKKLAQVFEYLLDMSVADRDDLIRWDKRAVTWVTGLDIRWAREQTAKLSPAMRADLRKTATKTKVDKSEAKARRLLADAEVCLKLAEKRVARWRKTVRYYDQKAAKS